MGGVSSALDAVRLKSHISAFDVVRLKSHARLCCVTLLCEPGDPPEGDAGRRAGWGAATAGTHAGRGAWSPLAGLGGTARAASGDVAMDSHSALYGVAPVALGGKAAVGVARG